MLPLATLTDAHASLAALGVREWVAILSEADFAEGRSARARWAELGRLATAIERELAK